MNYTPEELGYIEAELTLRATEDGGRKTAIGTGYRPNWWLPGESERVNAGGTVELVDADELVPGATGTIRIYPFVPEVWERIEVGARLEVNEGPRPVGRATVTRVVPAAAIAGRV